MSDLNYNDFNSGHLIANRYKVLKLLGSGGMGSVYLCEDQFLEGTNLAVKVLHREFCTDPNLEKRFLREIQLMNSVSHKNVVRTFDAGRDHDILYFTMEVVTGTPLDDLFLNTESGLGIGQFCNLAYQICEGLEAIHKASIIHRDLKPSNIMVLADGTVKITDFGVARPKTSKLTQHNEIIGSVDYMAPEIWLGTEISTAVDIYSLGIIFYQMITCKLPFSDEEPSRMMMYHVKRPPTPPLNHKSDIPQWLNHLILRMLAKASADRPKSAAEIAHIIQNNAGNLAKTASGKQAAIKAATSSGKLRSISASGAKLNQTNTDEDVKDERTVSRIKELKRKKKLQNYFLISYASVGVIAIFYLYQKADSLIREILALN